MKPVTMEVADLIRSGSFENIDRVFSDYIPKETQSDVNSTDVLVTESSEIFTDYANNDFRSINHQVEIQIFYNINFVENMREFELKFIRFFKKNNWYVDQSKAHTIDPDTDQVTKVFYFYQKQKLKEDI